jgi:hypothetical protein
MIAINWQMWHEAGIAANVSTEELRAQAEQTVDLTGLPPLISAQGIQLLERSAQMLSGSGLLCYGNRERLLRRVEQMYDAGLIERVRARATVSDEQALSTQTEVYVKRLLAELLKVPLERFESEIAFSEYGLDSILITRFNARLAKDLPNVSKTLLFEYSNAVAVSRYLIEGYRAELEQLFAESGSTSEAPAAARFDAPSISLAPVKPDNIREDPVSIRSRDVAIIGVAGRYPGASDLNTFWLNLREGCCSVREISPDRWEGLNYYDPDPAKASQGKLYCKWGGFLDGVDEFDAQFFNISPAEAEAIDPQERLFLETAWHALEDAGYARSQLERWRSKEEQENVGVYVGVTHNTYQILGVLRNAKQLE